MDIIVGIGKFVLNLIYKILKFFPVKNKIVFLSRQHDKSNMDFDLLKNQIKKDHPEYEVVILTKMIHEGLVSKLGYIYHMFVQMFHLATSKVAIIDTYCITVSILHHKKSLKVIQLWHAIGAFKKFGYSILGQEEGASEHVAKLMNMHENYDYVCTSSIHTVPFFAEAFHVEESKMIVKPLPRLDILLEESYQENIKEQIYSKYAWLKDNKKKVILYAPTFRKNGQDMKPPVEELYQYIDKDKYILIVKFHPLTKQNVNIEGVLQDTAFDTLEMCLVADYVITDYSAFVYEAAMLKKPLFFYAFDFASYHKNRNFYIDFEKDLPQKIMVSAKEVIHAIEHDGYDLNKIEEFVQWNISPPEKTYTKDLSDFIFNNCIN